jgi:AraC-like DNA-binding protein
LTVKEVAQRLDYAETSGFTHAFTRWKGVGPHSYQRSRAMSTGTNGRVTQSTYTPPQC